MTGKFSRNKGARWERDLAKILTAAKFPSTRNARNGISTDDIAHTIPDVHIEAKNCARLEIPKWWEQAEKDSDGRKIVLAIKRARKPAIVILELDYYLELERCRNGL